MSSFSGLNTALTSLFAQQRGLDVTGQNVANASTEGYSRQRAVLQSQDTGSVPALWSTQRGPGTGVSVEAVQRLRDTFLESRAQTEHGREASMTVQSESYARIEQSFGEPGDTGLQNQLSELWGAFADLRAAPGEQAQRSAVLARAGGVADTLRRSAGHMDEQWHLLREQVVTTVDAVNRAASDVAELNDAILRATSSGLPANELSDRRDLLVMSLADLTGATARGGHGGMVDVVVNGVALVRGGRAQTMHVTAADPARDMVGDPVAVTWDGPAGLAVGAGSGRLQGEVTTLEVTLPAYLDRLDTVAGQLRESVNAVHATGFDLDGAPGQELFVGGSARDLAVGVTDHRRLAADSAPGVRDGGTAASLAALATAPGGVDATYRALVVDLGGATKALDDRLSIQRTLSSGVDASREAYSGVNLDEEMVNLLGFQHAYEGAARVLTAVDEMLDTLINRTGTVGR